MTVTEVVCPRSGMPELIVWLPSKVVTLSFQIDTLKDVALAPPIINGAVKVTLAEVGLTAVADPMDGESGTEHDGKSGYES